MTLIMALALAGFAQDEDLTPARTLELLEETRLLMRLAEERLNEAEPGTAEKHGRGAADRLAELIRKAAAKANPARNPLPRRNEPPPGSPEPSKFRGPTGSWGRLPPELRRAMLAASQEDVPPEFQEQWRQYRKAVEDIGR